MEGIILAVASKSNYIQIIKVSGNPTNIKSYYILSGYNLTFKPSNKNLLCGTVTNFYCNIYTDNSNILGYTNRTFFTRSVPTGDYKYLQFNKNVPNVFIFIAEIKYLMIVTDFAAYTISQTSYPSYSIPINNLKNNLPIQQIGNSSNNGNVYILNNQYIFILCLYGNINTLFRFDIINKIFKLIFSDPTNTLWGFNVIDLNNIYLLLNTTILVSSNCTASSDTYTWDPTNNTYKYIYITDYQIKWTSLSILTYIPTYKFTNEFKFYPNENYLVIKDHGVVFLESNKDSNTYYINSPINILSSSVLEQSTVLVKILSQHSKNNKDVCNIINDTVIYPLTEGSCIIQTITAETTNYNSTKSDTREIFFSLLDQDNLVLANDLSTATVGDIIDLVIDGGSTNSIINISALSNNITIKNNTLTCVGSGNAILFAFRKGNEMYNNIMNEYLFLIKKGSQNIILNDINYGNELYVKETYNLVLSNVKENATPVFVISKSFDVNGNVNNNICVLNNNRLYVNNGGTCQIHALISETSSYNSYKTNILYITLRKNKYSDIDFFLSNKLYYKNIANISDRNSNLQITFIPITKTICTISGSVITALGSGPCTIAGIRSEINTNYNLIQYYTFDIDKQKQPSLFLNNITINNTIYIDNRVKYNLTLSGVLENANIKFIILNNYDVDNNLLDVTSFNGYISGNNFTPLKSGYCDIAGITYETDNYLESTSNIVRVLLLKSKQSPIAITKSSELYYLSSTILSYYYLDILYNASDYDIIYSSNSDNIIIKNNTIFGQKVGNATITALKPGNYMYEDVITTYDITVKKIRQNFNINNILNNVLTVGTNPYSITFLNLYENPSNIRFVITKTSNLTDTNKIVIADNKLYPYSSGNYTIVATCSETTSYLQSDSNPFQINIIRNQQLPLNIKLSNELDYMSSSIILTEGGSTDFAVKFTSDSSNCNIVNNTILGLHAGSLNLTAYKNGNYMYEPISSTINITINKIPQRNFILYSLSNTNIINVNPNKSYPLITSQVNENSQIVYSIKNINKTSSSIICTINGNQLIPLNEGSCLIQATALSTDNYSDTSSNLVLIAIVKNKQNQLDISFNPIMSFKNNYTLIGSGGSDTGFPVVFTSDSSNCTISNNILTPLVVNRYNITAFKDGNFMYYPISQVFNIIVMPIKQNITIIDINHENQIEVDPDVPYPLLLEKYEDNPTITFKIINMFPDDNFYNNVCELKGNILTAQNAGKCIIRGYTSATTNYLASETPDFILTVTLKSAKNFIIDNLPKLYIFTQYYLTVNGGSFDNIAFEITCSNPNVHIINNAIISNVADQYNISVTEKGNFKYKSLTKNISIIINKIDQPTISILNIKSSYLINRNYRIKLSTSYLYENSLIDYRIVSESNPNVCIINTPYIIANNAGTCIIQAVSSETTNYNSTKSQQYIINIYKNNQVPIIFNKISPFNAGSSIALIFTGGNGSGSTRFIKSNDNCFITNISVLGVSAGQTQITLYKDGDDIYNPITANITLTILKNYQNVTLLNLNKNNELYINDVCDLIITNIKENANIKYAIADVILDDSTKNTIANITENVFHAVNSGVCLLYGIVAATENYLETKTNSIMIKINKLNQSSIVVNSLVISDDPITLTLDYGSYLDLNINGGNTNNINIKPNNQNCIITNNNKIFSAPVEIYASSSAIPATTSTARLLTSSSATPAASSLTIPATTSTARLLTSSSATPAASSLTIPATSSTTRLLTSSSTTPAASSLTIPATSSTTRLLTSSSATPASGSAF